MFNRKKIKTMLQQVEALEEYALSVERSNKAMLKHIHPNHLASARNLLHYLAIRSQDIRKLQTHLSELGISSSSHAESYTFDNLNKIKYLLSALAGISPKPEKSDWLSIKNGAKILKHNSTLLFGRESFHGQAKIMVTLPTEAAADYSFVNKLVKSGMHIARINTAHDDAAAWKAMITHIKAASKALGRGVKIYMDIEGPKIRTGKIIVNSAEKEKHFDGEEHKEKKPHIRLFEKSRLKLTKFENGLRDSAIPAVALTLPEIFGIVNANESVWFDDGQLGGTVLTANDKEILVEITHAPEEGFKLKSEKGVNFPESALDISALTTEGLVQLDFIAKNADMLGFSFIQNPDDVILLQKHLKKLKREDMGIILKIETQLAFENLPYLLFTVMRSASCGIMIARGDLAVEIGYKRIAEVQEEILWLAEAAHVPVIWATQVLETLIKKGVANRAEVSDVAKAARAECVMLNKGPHIFEAINTIRDIDKRMAAHEDKKRKILRPLHVASHFVNAIK